MDFSIILNFSIALAFGALVGIERQRGQKSGGFAGVRTFIFISFLGALSGFLYQEFDCRIMLPIIFLSVVLIIIASYIPSSLKGYVGVTAEISAFIIFILGFIIMFDDYRNYALIFGVLITILLSFKKFLHNLAEGAREVEWNDTLKFALIAFVILPLLPEKVNLNIFGEGRFYDLNFLYPREIWLLVVFVCAISFIGYFILKVVGTKKGANMIGAIGGIVSSTAVTQSMASHSKGQIEGKFVNHKPLVNAVLLASLVSYLRVFIISTSINRELFYIALPILMLVVIGLFIIIISSRKSSELETDLRIKSPLKLKPALILGSLYAILTFLSKLSFILKLGKSGIIITSIITGFFDIDPIILTVSSLSKNGIIIPKDAICAILLAVCSNQITKSFVAISTGSKKFGKSVAKVFLSFVILLLFWILYFKFL